MNPLDLEGQLNQEIEDNRVDIAELYKANALVGVVEAWRNVERDNGVDKPAGHWGWPVSDAPAWPDGVTNLQWLTRWMANVPAMGDSPFLNAGPKGGRAEIQLKYQGHWYSAASILHGHPMEAAPPGSELYMEPGAPPKFNPIAPPAIQPAAQIVTSDVVGDQFISNAWHASPYGLMMLSQSPDPSAIVIDAPGPLTAVVSPTRKLHWHPNPFFAGSGFWMAN